MKAQDDAPLHHWRLRLRHDRGFVSIRLTATSECRARDMIMKIERCPERAIRRVDDLGPVLKDPDQLSLAL